MPPKKAAVAAVKSEPRCILQFGRENNVIEWREAIYNIATGLYGTTGMFFHLNRSYKFPPIQLRDYHPNFLDQPEAAEGAAAEGEDEGNGNETDDSDAETVQGEDEPEAVAEEFTEQFINKLREGAYDRRQKAIEQQRVDECKMWAPTWELMSLASQRKVREDPRFEAARLALDTIRLWRIIRRSHLTHMFGDHDNMTSINLHDQQLRYNALRQGDRETIAEFKTRFDNQLKANSGVGMTDIGEPLRALDFISKLDTKRYSNMLTVMRNNACQNIPGAYPDTLASAFRTASTWIRDGALVPLGSNHQHHSAYLADAVHVTKAKDPEKGKTPSSKKNKAQLKNRDRKSVV